MRLITHADGPWLVLTRASLQTAFKFIVSNLIDREFKIHNSEAKSRLLDPVYSASGWETN